MAQARIQVVCERHRDRAIQQTDWLRTRRAHFDEYSTPSYTYDKCERLAVGSG